MTDIPCCPKCHCPYTYQDGPLFVCPDCAHEWSNKEEDASPEQQETNTIKDAHGNVLHDGDTVTVIKDLKVKGSSLVIKVGTKAKILRIVTGDHDLDCKVDGMGSLQLKSQFVKKVFP